MRKTSKIILATFVALIVSLLAVIFLSKHLLLEPYIVKGNSMMPTFVDGDYLLVNKAAYLFSAPKRGDLVVVRVSDGSCVRSDCPTYLKRIIALSGETFILRDGTIKIASKENPDGATLTEPYIGTGLRTLGTQTKLLGSDEYFVLGDNREPNGSSDSREWGPVKKSDIVGRVK